MTKCCGFCKHYILLGEGVTVYREHTVEIGYCPKAGDNLEAMDIAAQNWDKTYGNWDEAYRWASHTECQKFELDEISYDNPFNQYLKEL